MNFAIPIVPNAYSMAVFLILFSLLVQKEVLRAWGRPGSPRWIKTSNILIIILLFTYGVILLLRLVSFSRGMS